MENATQLQLGQKNNRFTKRQSIIICAIASALGLVTACILSLTPNQLEADALKILSNQGAWWNEEARIVNYDSQIAALEILRVDSVEEQLRLQTENDVLRQNIETQLSGF